MGLLLSKLVNLWRATIGLRDVAVVDAEVPFGAGAYIESQCPAAINTSIQPLHCDESTPLLASQSSEAAPTTAVGTSPPVQTEILPSPSFSARPVTNPELVICNCNKGRFYRVEAHTRCPQQPCDRHGKNRHTHTPRQFLDWAKILLTNWASDPENNVTRTVMALYMVPLVFDEQKRVLLRQNPTTKTWAPPGISWMGEL